MPAKVYHEQDVWERWARGDGNPNEDAANKAQKTRHKKIQRN
jgi:hypothetical protein